MVEPLEETRVELVFATEPLLSSLEESIPGSRRNSGLVELDEVEVCISSMIVNDSLTLDRRYKRVFCKSAKVFYSSTRRPN